ncbi:3073_t:CDS:2, partial [Racocetra fulgida]
GNGGLSWVNDHIEAFINIGGPLLGVPKALSALLSELGAFGIYVLERFFSKRERSELFRTWGGLSSMLPKGGAAIWGNTTHAPDDREKAMNTFGSLLTLRSFIHNKLDNNDTNQTAAEIIYKHTSTTGINFLQQNTDSFYNKMLSNNYSFGMATSEDEISDDMKDHTKWTNPLESRLPYAPEMKIYCLYGWGKETERSYYYSHDYTDDYTDSNESSSEDTYKFLNSLFIDSSFNSDHDPNIKSGVHNGEG